MTARQKGFTLIEVLISVGILLILFTTLYVTFDATHKASERVEAEADHFRLARFGFDRLIRDISMIYQAEKAAPTVAPNVAFEGVDRVRRVAEGDFPDDSLRFTTLSHGRTTKDAPESDKSDIRYYLQDARLIREATLANGRVVQDELGEPVWGLNFRYLNADGVWVDEWDTTRFPASVEVEMTFKTSEGKVRRLGTRTEIQPVEGGL